MNSTLVNLFQRSKIVRLILITLFAALAFSPAFAQNAKNFKITHGPYLQSLDETSVTFVWTTDHAGTAWVELAPDDSSNFYKTERRKYFSTSNGLKNIDTVHRVSINNLEPGKKYRYRVFSQEVLSHNGTKVYYGDVAATRVYRAVPPAFTTNDHSKKDISFLMLNDIHERNDVMASLLKDIDKDKPDLIFFNGDMVSNLLSEKQMFDGFMDTAVKLFASEIPMYYARGNHETRGNFAGSFPQYFPGPEGKLYYMFRQGPVCFIVLDSGEDKPDSDIEYSGITAYDEYRDEQAVWLKKALDSEVFKEAPFKVVISHIPALEGWHGQQEIIEKFVPLLNKAGIDVMLSGHLHRNLRTAPSEICNFPIVVNSNNSVLKVSADRQKMNLKVIDVKGALVDSLTINKP